MSTFIVLLCIGLLFYFIRLQSKKETPQLKLDPNYKSNDLLKNNEKEISKEPHIATYDLEIKIIHNLTPYVDEKLFIGWLIDTENDFHFEEPMLGHSERIAFANGYGIDDILGYVPMDSSLNILFAMINNECEGGHAPAWCETSYDEETEIWSAKLFVPVNYDFSNNHKFTNIIAFWSDNLEIFEKKKKTVEECVKLLFNHSKIKKRLKELSNPVFPYTFSNNTTEEIISCFEKNESWDLIKMMYEKHKDLIESLNDESKDKFNALVQRANEINETT